MVFHQVFRAADHLKFASSEILCCLFCLRIIRRMLWTVAQVAEFLQCSTCWVYRHKHELPLIRVGGMIRFDSVRLQEMVSRQPPAATLTRTVDSLYWHKKWGRS